MIDLPELKAKNYVLSPQSLQHVRQCPASRVYTSKRPKPSFANWFGIAVHLYLEKFMKYGREAALMYIRRGKLNKYAAMCARIDVAGIPKGDPEVQFLIDTQTRTGLVADSWADGDPDVHVAARCDLVVERASFPKSWADPRLRDVDAFIVDYKSGATAHLQDPESSQMLTLAIAKWLYAGKPDWIGTAIGAINTTDGKIVWRASAFGKVTLHRNLERLRQVHLEVLETRAERRDGVEPEFKPGAWCLKCSAQLACEAYKAAYVVAHAKAPGR